MLHFLSLINWNRKKWINMIFENTNHSRIRSVTISRWGGYLCTSVWGTSAIGLSMGGWAGSRLWGEHDINIESGVRTPCLPLDHPRITRISMWINPRIGTTIARRIGMWINPRFRRMRIRTMIWIRMNGRIGMELVSRINWLVNVIIRVWIIMWISIRTSTKISMGISMEVVRRINWLVIVRIHV